jgi:Na+/H+ antiporter NhaC
MKTILLSKGQNVSPTSYIDYNKGVWITIILLVVIACFAIRVWWSLRKDEKIREAHERKWLKWRKKR